MHLAYHIYVFFAGLCGFLFLSQGVDRCRASPPHDESTYGNLLPRTDVTANQDEFSFVMLVEKLGAMDAGSSEPHYKPSLEGKETTECDEMQLMQKGRDKRKRSTSPRRRRQKPQTREGGDREDRGRGRQDTCDEEEWEWDEDARRYFRRQWRSRERTSTSSWARLQEGQSRPRAHTSDRDRKQDQPRRHQ